MRSCRFSLALLIAVSTQVVAQGTRADYLRAEQFLPWHSDSLVLNNAVAPQWIGETDRFWYRRELADGKTFQLIDPVTGTRGPAFDHALLAAALDTVLEGEIKADHLPFDRFTFTDDGNAITGDGCFEIELQFVAEVRATEHLGSAAAATSTKDVTEHVTEDIAETFCTEAALSAGPTAQAVVPKLIVG